MVTPFDTYTIPSRFAGLPGVLAMAESAGTIASSSGSDSVMPTPRRNVRLGRAFFVIIMTELSWFPNHAGHSNFLLQNHRRPLASIARMKSTPVHRPTATTPTVEGAPDPGRRI